VIEAALSHSCSIRYSGPGKLGQSTSIIGYERVLGKVKPSHYAKIRAERTGVALEFKSNFRPKASGAVTDPVGASVDLGTS
jgi:hypothetical protein